MKKDPVVREYLVHTDVHVEFFKQYMKPAIEYDALTKKNIKLNSK